uniref:Uncharacterized protein n=1 Tax=Oryza rufipogon TaxID=4529 RepID=A0A0E0PEE7_ORYRU
DQNVKNSAGRGVCPSHSPTPTSPHCLAAARRRYPPDNEHPLTSAEPSSGAADLGCQGGLQFCLSRLLRLSSRRIGHICKNN